MTVFYLLSFGVSLFLVFLGIFHFLAAGTVSLRLPRVQGSDFAGWRQRRRIEKVAAQFPNALDRLAGALRSGMGLDQAVGLLASEGEEPSRGEWELVRREVQLGRSLEEALEGFARRVPAPEIQLAVSAISVSREVGGNLSAMLSEIARTVRARRSLFGRLKSMTAQGKMQGWVVGMVPVLLGILLYLWDPVTFLMFLKSKTGLVLLAAGALLEIAGILWIRRIVRLDDLF